MTRFAVPVLLMLGLASEAAAGGRIVTPRLPPGTDGALFCTVVNASDKKEVMVEVTLYQLDGVVAGGPLPLTLGPNESGALGALAPPFDLVRHCVVEIVKGGRKSVRVSLYSQAADGSVIAAVSGF